MLCESIRRDPAWQGGRYTTQPPALAWASTFFALASNGGTTQTQLDDEESGHVLCQMLNGGRHQRIERKNADRHQRLANAPVQAAAVE